MSRSGVYHYASPEPGRTLCGRQAPQDRAWWVPSRSTVGLAPVQHKLTTVGVCKRCQVRAVEHVASAGTVRLQGSVTLGRTDMLVRRFLRHAGVASRLARAVQRLRALRLQGKPRVRLRLGPVPV